MAVNRLMLAKVSCLCMLNLLWLLFPFFQQFGISLATTRNPQFFLVSIDFRWLYPIKKNLDLLRPCRTWTAPPGTWNPCVGRSTSVTMSSGERHFRTTRVIFVQRISFFFQVFWYVFVARSYPMVFGEPIDQVWGEFIAFFESNIVYGFCLAGLCGEPGGHPKPKTEDLQAGSAGCRWFVLNQLSKCHNPLLSRKYHILLWFFAMRQYDRWFCNVRCIQFSRLFGLGHFNS